MLYVHHLVLLRQILWEDFFSDFCLVCFLKGDPNNSGYTQDIFSTQGPVVYEAGPFIYIRNAAFFLNFADLLLQEQDERISGDCLGTFFLKFRGPAVARAR